MSKKINDLLTLDQLLINRPATINIDIDKNGQKKIIIEGTFADILGGSFDMISGMIEKGGIKRELVYETLTKRKNTLREYCKKLNYVSKDSYMHFHINEKSHINYEAHGTKMDFLLSILDLIEYLVDYYDITYDEYVKDFLEADESFVRNNCKNKMDVKVSKETKK